MERRPPPDTLLNVLCALPTAVLCTEMDERALRAAARVCGAQREADSRLRGTPFEGLPLSAEQAYALCIEFERRDEHAGSR